MGIRRNIVEATENVGAGTADFVDNLTDKVADFACGFWQNYPRFIAGTDDLFNSFVRGYMNGACAMKGTPPPPEPLFLGGQCMFNYRVFFRYGPAPGVEPTLDTGTNIASLIGQTGPLQEVEGTIDGQFGTLKVTVADGTTNTATGQYEPGRLTKIFIVPPSGQQDNCGDPPPQYPNVTPPPSAFQQQININSQDGDVLNYDLEYAPVLFNFPMQFDISGIKVDIDLGGINFYFQAIGINGVPSPLPGGQPPPLLAPGDDKNRTVGVEPVRPPSSEEYIEEIKDETDPKEEEIGEEIEFVKVTLTSKPNNIKNQFGDGAPDVYYAGWFEFQSEGYNFPRQPIHFNNAIYRKPDGATGYAYTLYEGITGFATIYKLKLEE